MAVVKVAMRPGRTFQLDNKINRKYSVPFHVIVDNKLDGPGLIRVHPNIPKIGQVYRFGSDYDPLAYCQGVELTQGSYPYRWEGVANYDTQIEFAPNQNENPLLRPAIKSWDFQEIERALVYDVFGNAIHNSAKDRFDPSPTNTVAMPTLTIVRNELTYSSSLANTYFNSVNSDQFILGILPRQARIHHITGREMFDTGIRFWEVTYVINFLQETFDRFLLDAGYRDVRGHAFRDPLDATPLGYPSLLNGKGYSIAPAATKTNDNIGTTATELMLNNVSVTQGGVTNREWLDLVPNFPFNIRVENEVMTVINGSYDGVGNPRVRLRVARGQGGSAAAAHSVNANVTLEPYYLRYVCNRPRPFLALGLPII